MSIQTPLDFQNYFISALVIKANPAYEPRSNELVDIPLSVKLAVKEKKDDSSQFLLQLEFDLGNPKKNLAGCPYYIHIHISGFFQVMGSADEKNIFELKHLNAPAILYGIARSIIAQNTATAEHGKFIVPSTNFVELLKQKKTPEKKVRKPATS